MKVDDACELSEVAKEKQVKGDAYMWHLTCVRGCGVVGRGSLWWGGALSFVGWMGASALWDPK